MQKEARFAGADNLTPSVPQYFSWINSTNEGSTEAQTLINLEYFRYMRETYGMQIRIYAWDAGNFDGASEGYGNLDSAKFRSQYPEGYRNVAAKAKALGIRMGLWGSPDGFGDDPETERKRYEFYVHLCRDYGFGEFKIDGVCGQLRPEKAGVFAKMLQECRKYVPELIVLNHRLPLYEAEPYVTTYLWQGAESYTDVCCTAPSNTAMHNRSYFFTRGHVDNLDRLAEDHGVCLSSSMDYFEDELIYQAFSRSLILAPEIYGNPWLLKDSEQPRLARIYNLHRRNADILVHGLRLPDELGAFPISRGSDCKRFLCTGNNSWNTKTITVRVDDSIGITKHGKYQINLRHPYDCRLAEVEYGESFTCDILPFRAALIEIASPETADPILTGMAYEVIREDEAGHPLEYKVLQNGSMDIREKAPVALGALDSVSGKTAEDEFLYETAMFAISNDALEYQSLRRAGATAVPEIQAARDAFFDQTTYKVRGCEARALFDGREDTFFDFQSANYRSENLRVDGGCLRVDLGGIVDADRVEIVSFVPNKPTREVQPIPAPDFGSFSCDLHTWQSTEKAELSTVRDYSQTISRFRVHTLYDCPGTKVCAAYPIRGKLRYFRLPVPMDRIYSFRVLKNGKEAVLPAPRANNMQAAYDRRVSRMTKTGSFTLPAYRNGARLALAVNGFHGCEGVYAVFEADGVFYGADYRSSAFKANHWEHRVLETDACNTLFFTLPENLAGKTVRVYALFNQVDDPAIDCAVWLCDRHD